MRPEFGSTGPRSEAAHHNHLLIDLPARLDKLEIADVCCHTCSSLVTFKLNTKLTHCRTSDLLCVWACRELFRLIMLLAIAANDGTCAAEVRQAARLPMQRAQAGSSLAPRATTFSDTL
jgi:hypothetical protein